MHCIGYLSAIVSMDCGQAENNYYDPYLLRAWAYQLYDHVDDEPNNLTQNVLTITGHITIVFINISRFNRV